MSTESSGVNASADGCGCFLFFALLLLMCFLFIGEPDVRTLLHQFVIKWLQARLVAG